MATSSVTTQGIGSGLDIAGIIDKLMTVEQAPLTKLQVREASYQSQLSTFGSLKGSLAAFQTSVQGLADASAFNSVKGSIADSTVASIAVNAANAPTLASHTLQVTQLAQNQIIATSDLPNTTDAVGTGTITLQFGTYSVNNTVFTANTTAGTKTITIGAANQSLAGIRDAINQANAGVTASIVNDGAGNRLVLSTTNTGAANSLKISVADDDGTNTNASGLSALAFDPTALGGTPQTTQYQAAQDAKFSIDGIAITKPSNTVSDALQGVTLTLLKITTAATSFSISQDNSAADKAVNAFVAGYNTLAKSLAQMTSYNATTKTAGPLLGDSSVLMIQSRMRNLLGTLIPNNGSVSALSDIGVAFQKDGTLAFDQTKLDAALGSNPQAVATLFASTGSASDSLVGYKAATSKAQPGSYPLTISQLATHGTWTGAQAAGLTITAGVNDALRVTVDGVAANITLNAGTYANADALVAELQSKVSGASAFTSAGITATVSEAAGVIAMTSARYGSASLVTTDGSAAAINLLGASPTGVAGIDVAGTLGGQAFLGSGQGLTGATGSATEGLSLTVLGGATGTRGTVSYSRGIAAQLNDLVSQFLDPVGLLAGKTDGINATIKDLQKQEASWTLRLQGIRARYTAQYNAMDALVAKLNSTSSYLTQQIAALQNVTPTSSNK